MSVLNDWATDPDASHVAVTPDDAQLEDLFADLAANISKPGATNLVVDEKLNPDFAIVSVNQPDKGTAVQSDDTTLQWSIPQLGVSGNEGTSLEFFIRHVGQDGGTKAVNASITYSDTEGNMVSFRRLGWKWTAGYRSCRRNVLFPWRWTPRDAGIHWR